jgi:hypothetical protein
MHIYKLDFDGDQGVSGFAGVLRAKFFVLRGDR